MPDCPVVDEEASTQHIATDKHDYALPSEIRAEDRCKLPLETNLGETNRRRIQLLRLLTSGRPNLHGANGGDLELREDLHVDRGYGRTRVDQAEPCDRLRNWLSLLLEQRHEIRMQRDFNVESWAGHLERARAGLGRHRSRLLTRSRYTRRCLLLLFEVESVMDGHGATRG